MEGTETKDFTLEAFETVAAPISGSNEDNREIITGMDPNIYNAAFEGNMDAFKQVQDLELQLTPNKNTVLHVHFTAETESVSKEFVEFIISSCSSLVLQANSKGETPLHIAARYGHLVAVEMLIEAAKTFPADLESGIAAEKSFIRATNKEGDSALHEAVRNNHIQVVRLLTKEYPDYPYCPNKDGETPLYIAVERSYKDIVDEMLKNCKSPAYVGPNGRTALHSAVLHRDEGMVKGLLEKEHLKSSIREADELGCVPLHLAAQNWDDGLTKLLLEHDRKTAYMRDKEGRTALHLAARKDHGSIMEMMLTECPDCAEIVDNNGQNALHCAVSYVFYDNPAANIIIKKTSLSNLYNEKDSDGNTPLHLFSSVDHRYLAYDEALKFIEHHRVDKLAFNKQNRTAYDENHTAWVNYVREHRKSEYERRKQIEGRLVEYGVREISWQRIQRPAKKKDDDDSEKDEDEDTLKRAEKSHLVVATLIATVTFAAGFTLPGGTSQEHEHQGTPILKHNAAFQAFLVTDTIAMVLSASAVLIHMSLALIEAKQTRADFLKVAFLMTLVAMASMMIAFVAGTFAMLGVSSGLGIAILLLGLSLFFVPCFFTLRKALKAD